MNGPVRILMVEDRESDFDLAQREILKSVKHCALERVETRREFIQKLEAFQPDLILSSYNLPHFTGMEALQLTQRYSPLTPFIFWTASTSEDIAVECIKAGAYNYILKDNLKRLTPAITHALEKGRALLEGRRTEERYRSIFENSPEGIFQSTPEGRYLKLNPAMARMYGYDSVEEMIQSVTDISSQVYVDPQDRQEFIRLFEAEGMVVNLEMRNRRKDGKIIWTSTSARAVRDAEGRLLYYEGFLQDITGRKLAEEKLRENEQHLRVALQLVDLAVFNLDQDLRYTWMYQPQLGYNTEQVVGRTDAELLPAQDAANIMAIKQRVLESGIGARVETVVHAPEQTLVYDLIVEPMIDANGVVTGLTGATLDITAQKRAELERQAQLEVVQGLTSTNDLYESMRIIHQAANTVIHAENFFAVVYNEETGLFEEIYSVDQYDPPAAPSKLEKSITSHVYRTGQPTLMDQAQFDHLVERGEVELVGTNSAAWLGVPLKTSNGIYGVIVVQDYENPKRYSDRDLDFLATIGAQAALAIERRKAEEKLRQSETEYRYLFENNPHPMWAYDLKTLEFVAVNDAAVDKYGYTRAEFLDMTIADIRPAEDVDRLRANVAQSRPVLQHSGEWRHKLKDGTVIDVEINSHTLNLNGREAALVVARDITERKKVEAQVHAQEKRFRALIENSLDNISLLKADGTLIWENPAVNRNLGYTQDEFVGRNIFELMHPEDMGWTTDLFTQLLREPGSHQRGTFRLRHHNGAWRWTEAIAANMLDDPSVQAVVINYRDVTERKQAEIELQQRNDDLALINAINEAVIRGENVDAVARLLVRELKRMFSSEGCTIYLFDPVENSIVMQQYFLPEEIKRRIEKLIGGTIPLIKIPVREGGFFHNILTSGQGFITHDPHEIQSWMSEFTETNYLPPATRKTVRKLIPQIFKTLRFKSAIVVPLISDGKPVGLLDVSSRSELTQNELKRIESLSRQLTAAIQRQQADEKIRRSEQFLQGIQNALSAHIAILDENGVIIQVNATWRKFAEQNGYDGAGHGVGRNYLEVCDSAMGMNAEQAPETANAIRAVLSGRRREAWVEYPCHSPEEKRWFILRVTKFMEGNKTWAVLAHENVTERKQAEEAIRASQIQYQNLVETSHDLIWSVDAEGRFTYLNRASEEIYGYQPEELIGRSFFEIMDTQDQYGSLEKFKEAIVHMDEFREVETLVRHRNGDLVILSANSVVIRDESGKAIGVSGSSHNITERKRIEENLRESQERYRALFEDSPVSIWEEDFSEVKKYLDALKAQGVADLREYFETHPEALYECSMKIKVIDLNNAALQLYRANSKAELIAITNRTLSTGEQAHNLEDFMAIANGQLENGWDGDDKTITGEPLEISLKWSVVPGHEHDYSKVIVTVTDITARKRAEQELRESEERYRILINQLPAVVYTDLATRGSGVTQYVSPQIEHILGFTPEEWINGGFELWKNQIHPEDRAVITEQYLKCMNSGAPFKAEYRIRRKDGETIWVLDQSGMLFDSQGKPLSSHGIIYDITERKSSEKILRESEERFSSAFEYAPIGKALVAPDGRWLKVNPALCEIVGYPAEELIRSTFQDITHPDDLETDLDMVAQLLAGRINTYQMEKRYKHKQGHFVWVLLSVSLIRDEAREPLYFISQVLDITERRRVEENLRASEEKYRLLAEALEIRVNERTAEVQDLYNNAPCGYHSLDAQGTFVRVNQTELDWLGYTREELIGRPFQDILTSESRLVFKNNFPGFKQRGWVKDLEFDLLRKNGSTFPVLVSATAIYDESGDYVSSRSTLFDNTERKYALETLQLANAEMKRALRTKDEFLANMSHELRTPLNAILGLSESLLERTAGPLNERQQKYLGTVNESGHHLLELINDILDLAKVEAGQITLNPGKVDISAACQSSLRMIQQLARKKNQSVELEVEDNIGHIWADERRLKQMIVNLLSNAVKFTPEGGKLGLLAQVDHSSSQVLITVWDHGIGIREDDLRRLFQPFVQLDAGLTRESGGTGLGLALVAQMARLHGGSVSVSSQPGQGSRFTILLPWESAVTGDTLEKFKTTGRFPTVRSVVGEKKTILMVEDTDSVIMLVRDYLELSGYNVEVARDGVTGISKAISLHPALILMDVQMPGMDGLEAARRIRKEPALRDTPIIALTALAMPNDRERCLEAGMNDYLSKPINLKELVNTIQNHLSNAGRQP